MVKHHLQMAAFFLLACGLAACGGSGSLPSTGSAPLDANPSITLPAPDSIASRSTVTSSAIAAAPDSGSSDFAIDVGSTGSSGTWLSDRDYNGGTIALVTNTINTSHVSSPAPQTIYQSQRWAQNLTYAIPNLTPSASYTVRLHFVESYFNAAGDRVFNITANGVRIITGLDIFRSAGGANIALIEQFTSRADSTGTISIALNASVNNASIAGIEIIGSSGSVPTPAPAPPSGTGEYPIYSSAFTGNTPFHHTVSQLMNAGAVVLSSTIARNYWAEGLEDFQPSNQSGGVGPLYTAASGQSAYTFSCPTYGTCNASGLTVHFPSGAVAQTGFDHHLSSFDKVYLHGEVDGWGGASSHPCNLYDGTANCAWGGFYPFSGSGLAGAGSSGNAGGYAFGLMDITAQELLQGHIDHALGITQSCLDDGGVYPSIVGRASDFHCPSSQEPNAKYGDLIHLKSSVNVASLGYSTYCKVVAQALQTYGAYTADNDGTWGLALNMEYMTTYTGTNPWFTTIFPSMTAGGDGVSGGSTFDFRSCLNRIPASDIEVIQISSNLP